MERAYEFRRRLDVVHQANRRDPTAQPAFDEVAIGEDWRIVVGIDAPPLVLAIAKDLQDYFLTSMGESLLLRRVADVAATSRDAGRTIVLGTREQLPDLGADLAGLRSYRLVVTPNAERVIVCGFDDRGVGQGSYFLEDLMNLRAGPFLRHQDVIRTPLFSPRMTHSGWGLDEFPNTQLNAITHAGMDAILVFVTGVDRTPDEHTHHEEHTPQSPGGRYQDFNNLVDRAAQYGLDVYFYAYFRNMQPPHPGAPGAEQYYDGTYGAIFRACPRAKGIVLVGESVEFPSKDPHTTGVLRGTPTADGRPPTKPSPGWWPCVDYPEWLELLKTVIRRQNADADIVFWTYNWGYAPEADRLALIRSLPTDVSLLVTFEMFEPIVREGVTNICPDYTASFVGPGRYFCSEASAAHERGLRLYAMANTGGLTWDLGVVPYEPIPYQWAQRHTALQQARRDWGLSGLMENHHYGWWPSVVSDQAKWAYWTPSPPGEEICTALAQRDCGAAAPLALAAWRDWSEAIQDYVPTGYDQYGPFRTGPSYPLGIKNIPNLPIATHAMHGHRIIKVNYTPGRGGRSGPLPGTTRIDFEIRSLQRMAERWQRGVDSMAAAADQIDDRRRAEAVRQLGLARFFLYSIRTTIHVKQWWKLKESQLAEQDSPRASALLDQLVAVGETEIANAEATIPLVEADSRLGWEPTIDYVCDADHLRWKIAQVRRVLESELPAYRAALEK